MNTKKDILLRVYLSFLLFLIMAVAIVSKIVKIQYVEGKYYRSLSDSLTTAYATIEPIRGNIYSSDQRLMVTSLPIYEIRIDFKSKYWQDDEFYKANIDSLCIQLSDLFQDRSAKSYKKDIGKARRNKARYFLLKRNVNHNQLKIAKEFPILDKGRYGGGCIVEQRSKRIHPFNLLAYRTLGYTYKEKDTIKGKSIEKGVGLEIAYHEYLSGVSGQRLMQKISGGNWIPINYENEIEPEDGQDIITTIDINIQDVTEDALLKALISHEADHGCAVVMEVETGHIKAISNLKKNKSGNYTEKYNYAIGSATEPGSTFKLASAIVLLEKGIVKPTDSVPTFYGKRMFYEKEMSDGFYSLTNKLTFQRAFEKSSNVAFASLVNDNFSNAPNDFIDALNKLHITQKLGLKIPGEGTPDFKRPGDEGWSGISLPWMAIGYSLETTPLQLLTLYNAIANNGKMVKPQLVKEVRKVGKTTTYFETEVIDEKICSKRTCEYLQSMLKGVVQNGTAENIKSDLYQIAGKTGTSKMYSEGSYKREYQASFAGYFPADAPKYSCIVVIYHPKSGEYYGGAVAGPVFKEIADNIYSSQAAIYADTPKEDFNYVNMPIVRYAQKDDLNILSQYLNLDFNATTAKNDWIKILKTKEKLKFQDKEIYRNHVPDVKGMNLSDAVYLLENLKLKVRTSGYGTVKSQSIEAGSELIPYTTIDLKLG